MYKISRELTEVSVSGEKNQEQLMIKMIDKNQNAKEGMNERDRKEHMRELEKRREEKDLEKMIKKANQMQVGLEKKKHLQLDNTSQSLEQSETKPDQNFIGNNLDFSSNTQTAQSSSGLVGMKRFNMMRGKDDDAKNQMLLLQKSAHKPSVLDNIIKLSTSLITQTKQEKQSNYESSIQSQKQQDIHKPTTERPLWVQRNLIVKIKNPQSDYNNTKARVLQAYDKDKILLSLLDDDKNEIQVKESEITKVLPTEGGRVMILKDKLFGK